MQRKHTRARGVTPVHCKIGPNVYEWWLEELAEAFGTSASLRDDPPSDDDEYERVWEHLHACAVEKHESVVAGAVYERDRYYVGETEREAIAMAALREIAREENDVAYRWWSGGFRTDELKLTSTRLDRMIDELSTPLRRVALASVRHP
jgi:hypothetical protein